MPRWYTHTSLGYGCALNRDCGLTSFLMYNDILNGNDVLYLGLFFTSTPSSRLKTILNKYNLTNPVYVLEHNPINKLSLPVKQTLNSIAGAYLCINLINGHIYVGSASKNCMYRRYTAHLNNAKGGSVLVNRAVKKYGLENFAFVVIETTSEVNNKEEILRIEQKYIDFIKPIYNIAKIAGSILNLKWSLESKLRLRNSIKMKAHLENLRLSRKPVSDETRALFKTITLNRQPVSVETRQKMSLHNNKSIKIVAKYEDTNLVYKEFASIAYAAEHFYNDRTRRSPIKYALKKGIKFLDKYHLSYLK